MAESFESKATGIDNLDVTISDPFHNFTGVNHTAYIATRGLGASELSQMTGYKAQNSWKNGTLPSSKLHIEGEISRC